MEKILVDMLNGKEVWIDKELEGLYLRFRHYFKDGMIYIADGSTMIESLVKHMTTTDLPSSDLTFDLVHKFYVKNLLNLYEISNWHEKFLDIDILDEVEKILKEASKFKYIRFEVLGTKVNKHFYRLVNILLAEAIDEFELEEAFFDFIGIDNVLDHESFIKHAVAYKLFNKLEYVETRSLALHEVMLEVLLELARLFEKSLSKNNEVLKVLISYASDIADTVYDEVYRS